MIKHGGTMIKHEGGRWILYSADGSKKLGEHDSEKDAELQDRAIEAAKHRSAEAMRHLHLRGATGQSRVEQLAGREHLVVPVIALMEGVIRAVNADKPEFVSAATLAKAAASWNGRPVTLGHPTRGGRQCSANDPAVLASHGIGTVFNARYEGKKLLCEAWVDVEKASRLAPEMLARLRANTGEEVSVGAFVVTDGRGGSFNGKAYDASWAETSGDHLAFLPGGVGACSREMGCGTHRAAMHLVTAEGIEALGAQDGHPFYGNQHTDGSGGGDDDDDNAVQGDEGRRRNDGYEGSRTPREGNRVKVMGKVRGAGKRGRVTSAPGDGSFVYVEDEKGKALGSYHVSDLKVIKDLEGAPMWLKDRLVSLLRALMPRGWGDDEVKQELRDALLDVEPAFRNGGEIVRVKNDAVVYCLYPPANYYDAPAGPGAAMTYWQRAYTFDAATQSFTVAGERVEVEPTTVYEPIRAAKAGYEDCAACDGSGSKDGNPCESCDGTGELRTAAITAACGCKGESMKTKAERVAALLANEHNPLKDEKGLLVSDEKAIAALEAHCANAATLKAAADKLAADKKAADGKVAADLKAAEVKAQSAETRLTAAEAKITTLEGNQVTDEMRALVAERKATNDAEHAALVRTLGAASTVLTEEQLKAKSLDEMRTLAAFARVPKADYSGQGLPSQRSATAEDFTPPDPFDAPLKAMQAATH